MIGEIVNLFAAALDDKRFKRHVVGIDVGRPHIDIYNISPSLYLTTLWFHGDYVSYWLGDCNYNIRYEDVDIPKIAQHIVLYYSS